MCFAVASAGGPSCAAEFPSSFDVESPAASPDRSSTDFQNRATLLAAYRAAQDHEGDDRCSGLMELRVPVGASRLVTESRAGARVDRDVLELECRPARRVVRRLPVIATSSAAEESVR